MSQLAQATQLYRGDFLTDLHVPDSLAFYEWLLIEREQLRQQTCTALHALAGARLARGEPEPAGHCARRLFAPGPLE